MKWVHRLIRGALVIVLVAGMGQLAWGIQNVRHPIRAGRGEIGEHKSEDAWMNAEFGAFWTGLAVVLLILHVIVRRHPKNPISTSTHI